MSSTINAAHTKVLHRQEKNGIRPGCQNLHPYMDGNQCPTWEAGNSNTSNYYFIAQLICVILTKEQRQMSRKYEEVIYP
jgi:hypothetical protein